jgi:hypothetical protein
MDGPLLEGGVLGCGKLVQARTHLFDSVASLLKHMHIKLLSLRSHRYKMHRNPAELQRVQRHLSTASTPCRRCQNVHSLTAANQSLGSCLEVVVLFPQLIL